MKTIRLTMAQALVRYLCAQRTIVEGEDVPLFPGCFGIFGHGNVTCLSEALEAVKDTFPTWRGQNEQTMGLAALAFAKARRRRQIMVSISSIGPGATNMITAAAAAHTNRIPVLFLAGDTFASRLQDPVLQQIEQFTDPTITANDAFKAVTRYWDRITRPEQILASLPQAIATMLDPADCGPALIALAQDAQAEAFDYPLAFFETRVHRIRRPRPDTEDVKAAAAVIAKAKNPLIIAGGGVLYSGAEAALVDFAARRGIPVVETVAGRTALLHDDPVNAGVLGALGSNSANALAAEADVVIAVGTRLADFTTCSWAVFQGKKFRLVTINTARFDATKHLAVSVVGDALESIGELDKALKRYRAPETWLKTAKDHYRQWNAYIDGRIKPTNQDPPSYAQVVGVVNRLAGEKDRVMTAAGGLPGELAMNWRAKSPGTFDCEWGYSTMGYEIAGAWGAKMATPDAEVITMTGDGSYLMANSDIYSSVLTGHKLIVIVCDNGGFAVINRLQNAKGVPSFNNLIKDCKIVKPFAVDFVKHAESMGAIAEKAASLADLERAIERAKKADRTSVIVIDVGSHDWTENVSWWDVGVPEVSSRPSVQAAFKEHSATKKKKQRLGV